MIDMEEKKRKRSTIYVQVQKALLTGFLVIQILMTVVVIGIVIQSGVANAMRNATSQAISAAMAIEKYASRESLIRYWYEHADDMRLEYDYEVVNEMEKTFLMRNNDLGMIYWVTDDEFNALSEEDQKLFAEICYSRLCESFDDIKSCFGSLYLSCFIIVDDRMFFLINGTTYDELHVSQGGDIYDLGAELDYVPGRRKGLDALTRGEYGEKINVDYALKSKEAMASEPVFSSSGDFIAYTSTSESFGSLMWNMLRPAIWLIVVLFFLFAVIHTWIMRLLKGKVVTPITSEEEAILSYMREKDSEITVRKLEQIRPNNEVETLSESFSSMIKELDLYIDSIREITAEKERMSAELDVARQIQADMLPKVAPNYSDCPEFELGASMLPAKAVGGDFYDFFKTDEDHIVLVIGDVSDKGIPAALFMASAKNAIKNNAMYGEPLSSVICRANEILTEGNEESMFVSIWIAIIDLNTGHVISCNAGHEDPVIRRKGGRYEADVYPHDMVLGVMQGLTFEEREWNLHSGDSVYVYTDGVPDAQSVDDKFFGMEGLIESLNRDPDASAEKVISNINSDLEAFQAGRDRFDDTTMICFKYIGKSAANE